MNRLTLVASVLALSLVVGLRTAGAPARRTRQSAQAVTVPAIAVQRGDIQQTVAYSGDVRAEEQITVLPKASGRVQSVLVDLGSQVHAGDVLAELEQDSPEIQVLQARPTSPRRRPSWRRSRPAPRPTTSRPPRKRWLSSSRGWTRCRPRVAPKTLPRPEPRVAAQTAKLNPLQNGGRAGVSRHGPARRSTRRSKSWRCCRRARPTTCARRRPAPSTPTRPRSRQPKPPTPRSAAPRLPICESLQLQVDALTAQVNAAQTALSSANAALDSQKGSSAADIQAAQTAYRPGPGSAHGRTGRLEPGQQPDPGFDRAGAGGGGRRAGAAGRGRSEPDSARTEGRRPVRAAAQPAQRAGVSAAQRHRLRCGQSCRRRRHTGRQRGGRSRPGPARPAPPRRRAGQRRQPLRRRSTSAQALVKATKARLDALEQRRRASPARAASGTARPGPESADRRPGQPERRPGSTQRGSERLARRPAQSYPGAGRRGARETQSRPGSARPDRRPVRRTKRSRRPRTR